MIKQKLKNTGIKALNQRIAVVLLGVFFAVGFIGTQFAAADQFDAQINQLRANNGAHQQDQNQLHSEAASLQAKIDALQTQITGLENSIRENQAKSEDLQRQITVAEAELVKQKDLLGQNIKAMYLEGQISTLEMLASSKDLSEFVDKEQYRNSVKDKIKDTLDKVNALKLELKGKKDTLEKNIADQQKMQQQLDGQRAEQNRILGLNTAQRSELDAQIKSNNSKISDLKRQQAMENARLFGGSPGTGAGCGGGYPGRANGPYGPWGCNYPLDNTIDNWGMYNRECVSYTAFKVAASGRHMPYWGGRGNANQWDDNARAAGIPVDGSPRVGDVAVSNSGTWGHVMYVEAVGGDGSIYISDYNQQFDGNYREYWVSATTVRSRNLVFIHF